MNEVMVAERYYDIPGIRCERSGTPEVEVTTEYFEDRSRRRRRQEAIERQRKKRLAAQRLNNLAPRLNKLVEIDFLADTARQLGVWGSCNQAVHRANKRVRRQYQWCGMRKDGRSTLIENGYAIRDGVHVRHLERAGWEPYKIGGRR